MVLPYMGVVAILVMWSRCKKKQTVISTTHRGTTQCFALVGQSVLREKMFEESEQTTMNA